jgi:predicted adenylyl cyclase CyaB
VNLLQLGPQQCEPLAELLTASLTVKLRVVKRRDIYFLDNVKVHLDTVDDLGTFVEIEAIDEDGSRSVESLEAQCRRLMAAFGIDRGQLVPHSYSDLLASR